MANKLGAAFLRCSLGPLNYAGGCILSSKVEGGLNELSADNLHGGLKRGIEEVAKHAGVRVADVEHLLPMADVNVRATRLDAAQKSALDAWRLYAGHLGGLMQGVADLTVDGRAPDVSHFLSRLAKKVVRDRPLSEPLQALSGEVASWLDLVERCSDLIGDGDVLARAYRRRVLARGAMASAAGLTCVAAIGVIVWIHGVRARVDAALAVADRPCSESAEPTSCGPCAVTSIDPGDLARASSAQQQRAGERRAACEEARRREAEERAAAARREGEAREGEARKREQDVRCEALAQHVAAGALAPEDAAIVGASADLLGRVAKRALTSADLAATALPCEGSAAGAKIADAYAAALAASTAAWARPAEVSERAYAALVARKDSLPGSPKQVLAKHADRNASKAIVSKDDAEKARAMQLCRLTGELGIRGGKYCATLFVLAARR